MRILMVGNSLTAANKLPELLENELRTLLAGSCGQATDAHVAAVHVASVTRGGARLSEFSNPATKTGQQLASLLAEGNWDYLVMQDMSHLPATNPAAHAKGVAKLCALASTAGATPVVYGTWAYHDACPKLSKLGFTHNRMHELMTEGSRNAVASARSLFGATVLHANVAAAFQGASQASQNAPEASLHASEASLNASEKPLNNPGVSLYASDGVHPSQEGSHLAAAVIASTIGEHLLSRV